MTAPLTPQPIFDTLVAYQRSAALASAIELDVFTRVGGGLAHAAELARACSVSERGLRSLCDHLAVEGFLERDGAGYRLTALSARFLDRRSPQYIGSIAEFLHGSELRGAFGALTDSVRRGGTAIGGRGTLAPEHPAWPAFARGMAPAMAPQAEWVAERLLERGVQAAHVLDVSASHGLYGIACARRWPKARITFADWPNVLEVTLDFARRAGVAERCDTRPGDVLTAELGGPYDVVLVPNFLHHFDLAECERFLTRLRCAMRPGATLVVVEFVVEPDRSAPPHAVRFSLVMLATTPAGDSFTEAELHALASSAGFTDSAIEPLGDFGAHVMFARA